MVGARPFFIEDVTEHRGAAFCPKFRQDILNAGNAAEADNLNLNAGANVTDLSSRINVAPYLSKYSDIVALMVVEHQTNIQNFITRANFEVFVLRKASTFSVCGHGGKPHASRNM